MNQVGYIPSYKEAELWYLSYFYLWFIPHAKSLHEYYHCRVF